MILALTIIQVILSLALIFVVLLQHGRQQGLSGAIAGGAETFFGKNKGRTVDAMLKKFTSVVAILFIVSSITFAGVAVHQSSSTDAETTDTTEGTADESTMLTPDADGNLVDADGNIVMTADQLAEQQAAAEAEGEADTTDDGAAADTADEGTAADADTADTADTTDNAADTADTAADSGAADADGAQAQ